MIKKQLLLLLICSTAFAANRYVDNTATNGANTGLSWTDAWTSYTSISASAGDIVNFSGGTSGKSYSIGGWTPPRGTSGNPITYRPGQDSGHNGIVTFNVVGTQFLAGNLSDITFNGEYSGQSHFVINPCDFVVYSMDNTTARLKLLWLTFTGQIYCLVSHGELAYCNGTSPLQYGDDSMIFDWGAWPAQAGITEFGACSIHHNVFTLWRIKTQGRGWDCIKWTAHCDIYNNVFRSVYNAAYTGSQHSDAIQSSGPYVRIYNNYFENWISYGYLNEIFDPADATDNYIYNNLFFYSSESGIDWTAQTAIAIGGNGATAPGQAHKIIIANNTVIDQAVGTGTPLRGYALCDIYPPTNPEAGADCYIVNNYGLVLQRNPQPLLTVSHNTTTGGTVVNAALYPNGNWHWTSGSSGVIDQGINPAPNYLTSIFTTDFEGHTRTGIWDIGADDFGSGGADTNPPAVQSASVDSSGQIVSIVLNESCGFGAGGNTGFSLSAANVTLAYSSGAGSTTLNYTTSRVITNTESITLAYNKPATNAVEDASGNDLASFSGTNVVNNSAQPDVTAPTPNPMYFWVDPYAIDSAYIGMVATNAFDVSGTLYQVEVTRAGITTNSPYQSSTNFTFGPFPPSTQVSFRVRARDNAATPNVTDWSASKSATTLIVFPTFVSDSVGSDLANTVSVAITTPSLAANNFLTALIYSETRVTFTPQTGEGWTQAANSPFTNSAAGKTFYTYFFSKQEDGTPQATYTFTASTATDAMGYIACFSGCATLFSPFNIPPVAAHNTGNVNTYPDVSLTTTNVATLLVWMSYIFEGASTSTQPTGYTEMEDAGQNNNTAAAAFKVKSPAGAETATGASYAGSAGPTTTILFALQPNPPSDTNAPSITITGPTGSPSYSTSTNFLTISGTASDNFGVQGVTNSMAVATAGTTSWSTGLTFNPGTTNVTFYAFDAAGNVATDSIEITYVAAPGGLTVAVQNANANNLFAGAAPPLNASFFGFDTGASDNYAAMRYLGAYATSNKSVSVQFNPGTYSMNFQDDKIGACEIVGATNVNILASSAEFYSTNLTNEVYSFFTFVKSTNIFLSAQFRGNHSGNNPDGVRDGNKGVWLISSNYNVTLNLKTLRMFDSVRVGEWEDPIYYALPYYDGNRNITITATNVDTYYGVVVCLSDGVTITNWCVGTSSNGYAAHRATYIEGCSNVTAYSYSKDLHVQDGVNIVCSGPSALSPYHFGCSNVNIRIVDMGTTLNPLFQSLFKVNIVTSTAATNSIQHKDIQAHITAPSTSLIRTNEYTVAIGSLGDGAQHRFEGITISGNIDRGPTNDKMAIYCEGQMVGLSNIVMSLNGWIEPESVNYTLYTVATNTWITVTATNSAVNFFEFGNTNRQTFTDYGP